MAWAKIPTRWVREKGLVRLRWMEQGSDATAALIILIALAIKRNLDNRHAGEGEQSLTSLNATYDEIQLLSGLSRAKISKGIRLLESLGALSVDRDGHTNRYDLIGLSQPGQWGQLPQSNLYVRATIQPFYKYQLRHKNELHALKIYLALLAYRNSTGNFSALSYSKITEVTGVHRNDIPKAISLLINDDLVHIRQRESNDAEESHNLYYIRGLEIRPNKRRGAHE